MHARSFEFRFRVPHLLLALAVLAGAAAGDPQVDKLYIGSGSQSLTVALISDLHIGGSNTLAYLQDACDRIRGDLGTYGTKLVMVLGDISNNGDPSEMQAAADILNDPNKGVQIPWVPIIGNHDMWWNDNGNSEANKVGPAPGYVYPTRYFEGVFRSEYERLKSLPSNGDSGVRNFTMFDDTVFNWDMDEPYCNDLFKDFDFDVGPTGCPLHFVGLDFNQRHQFKNFWGQTVHKKGTGPSPYPFKFNFNDRAYSLKKIGNWEPGAYCVLYEDAEYEGAQSDPIMTDCYLLGDFDGKVSSVWLSSGCGGGRALQRAFVSGRSRKDRIQQSRLGGLWSV